MLGFVDPLKSVLHDYCHVEWFELSELVSDIKTDSRNFDVSILRAQFLDVMSNSIGFSIVANELTGNEFESDEEAMFWLKNIFREIFEV